MLKKIFIFFIVLIALLSNFISLSVNPFTFEDPDSDNYTTDKEDVLNTNIDDPLKEGTRNSVEGVQGIVDAGGGNSDEAQGETIRYISKWINYFLGLLAFVVIILIIKDGIVIITAAGDDNKQKESLKNVKNYVIALIMIGVSYLIVNLIIYFVVVNTKDISYINNVNNILHT